MTSYAGRSIRRTSDLPSRSSKLSRELVDLVGIEPTTSSMPWNDKNSNLLTAQALIVG
jgi:hypothetical protein